MSLKKPKEIPGIAKSRNKSIEKTKDQTPHKKISAVEFKCSVYFKTIPASDVQYYCLVVETVQHFSLLSYELSLQHRKNKNVIDVSILGLKTKNNYVNEPGPAYSELMFEELYGNYTINIIKQDGSINSAVFNFNIFKKDISLVEEFIPEKENNRKFCDFLVKKEKFSFTK
ncbi:MAG: hypothetical protein IPM56_12235 [Ignavibacteriales bacterium]|nr:MAG: hypothetical protein IPM56_12235 [Ignavibacteriales bacterium]